MRVNVSHISSLEAREMGKSQPTCVKHMTSGKYNRPCTFAFKTAFTLPTLCLIIDTMVLRLLCIVVVL